MKALAVSVAALTLWQAPIPQFRSGVDVVTVDALVTTNGRAVVGLKAGDFELRDTGVVQEIDSVSVDEAPVSMLLALDTSNSVEGPTLRHLKDAANAAIDSLTPTDRVAVLTFAEAVTLRASWAAPSPAMHDAVARAFAGGSTSLYDAAYAALTLKDERPGRRSFVVLFSDGGDSSSWLPARSVLERGRRSDAVVYLVTLRPPKRDVRLEYRSGVELYGGSSPGESGSPAIVELANMTGGQTFVTERADMLREAFAAVVTQFRNRYLITYRPRGVDAAGWHPIDLKVKGRTATIKARRGYAR